MKNMFLAFGLATAVSIFAEFEDQVKTLDEGKKVALVKDQVYSEIVQDLDIDVLRVSAQNEARTPYMLQVHDAKALAKVAQYRKDHYQYWWPANILAALTVGGVVYATQPESLEQAKPLIASVVALVGMDLVWSYMDKTVGLSSSMTVPAVSKYISTHKYDSLTGLYKAQFIESIFGKNTFSKWFASQTVSETYENILAGNGLMYVPVSTGDVHVHDPKEVDLNVYKITVHN